MHEYYKIKLYSYNVCISKLDKKPKNFLFLSLKIFQLN